MAKVKCVKCGNECCSCWGCNPSTYVDGVCPACQEKEKEKQNAPSKPN